MVGTDKNFWKDKYKSLWGDSSDREARIAALISAATKREVEYVGLGAGSKEYIAGAAADHGHARGSADLRVKDTPIYIEVTGPLVKFVSADQPLWIRPDKIEDAKRNIPAHETWVVHHLPKDDLLRVIRIDQDFLMKVEAGEFPVVHPTIRGQRETYIEIPASDKCVGNWDVLVDRIKNA